MSSGLRTRSPARQAVPRPPGSGVGAVGVPNAASTSAGGEGDTRGPYERGLATLTPMSSRPIRGTSVLPARRTRADPAHRRRTRAGRRARAAGRPRPGRDAGLPAPVADPRRHDGQPRDPQGVLPAARAGRPRRAALQHPGYVERPGDQRGAVRRGRGRAVRHRGRGRAGGVRRAAATCGCWAGRSAPTWSCSYGLEESVVGAVLLSPPLRLGVRRRPRRLGRRRPAAGGAGARARRLPASRTRPGGASAGCRRRRSSASTGPSTCGSGTPSGCSTRWWPGSRPTCPTPLPQAWSGPMETADSSMYADRTTGRVCGHVPSV